MYGIPGQQSSRIFSVASMESEYFSSILSTCIHEVIKLLVCTSVSNNTSFWYIKLKEHSTTWNSDHCENTLS